MAYIGKGLDNGVRNQFVYAATQGQTAFTGADSDGKTLAMTDILYVDCYQNGVKLKPTTDYTVSSTTLTLVNAASLNDVINIVSFDTFAVPDTVPASTGGTFNGAISATSYGAVSGTTGTFTGNVGIGTASPAHNLEIVSTASGSVNDTLQIRNNATASGTGSRIRFINSTDVNSDTNGASIASIRTGNDNDLAFETENAERMRIDSSGTVFYGCTALPDGSADGVSLASTQSQRRFSINSTSNSNQILFYNGNGLVGNINTSGSATNYVTSSDYRLKENVDYTWDATARLKQLKPARFNFKVDADTTVDGFLAHEVSSIVPEAITGAKDAMAVETRYTADDVETQGDDPSKNVGDPKTYSSSKIDSQGIDQSKLVPLLVKALQEQQIVIESLTTRITALEAE